MGYIWLRLAVTWYICAISVCLYGTRHPDSKAQGRIPEIDNYLFEHGEEITRSLNLDKVKAGLEHIANGLGYKYNPVFSKYYLEVLNLITKNGVEMINKERDRLDVILTSTAVHEESIDGGAEFTYAMTRKNILESFLDAIADYLINGMHNFGPEFLQSGGILNDKANNDKIRNEM
ncbi:hypothetical protein LSH36_37g13078 [Paralvinella palmiformis]|uniref:Endoplasmic reticulum resident protein 29 C-terminal domain-containing protein n=1 Tax=Paralvinella palmiformis TaxID=53620 RepID=A0AAD9K8Z9_9ANNE|nr:hypothetical protein LSH36_37g13078 [Paralvinella palmiformis]